MAVSLDFMYMQNIFFSINQFQKGDEYRLGRRGQKLKERDIKISILRFVKANRSKLHSLKNRNIKHLRLKKIMAPIKAVHSYYGFKKRLNESNLTDSSTLSYIVQTIKK